MFVNTMIPNSEVKDILYTWSEEVNLPKDEFKELMVCEVLDALESAERQELDNVTTSINGQRVIDVLCEWADQENIHPDDFEDLWVKELLYYVEN